MIYGLKFLVKFTTTTKKQLIKQKVYNMIESKISLKNNNILKISQEVSVSESRVEKLYTEISRSLKDIKDENQDKAASEVINAMFGDGIITQVINELGSPQEGESREDFIKRGKVVVENLASTRLSKR